MRWTARAGRTPSPVNLYLTEFGVQSEPDPISGVSDSRQSEYRAIGEWIAYRNPRVRAFSQYLMRDDRLRQRAQPSASHAPAEPARAPDR